MSNAASKTHGSHEPRRDATNVERRTGLRQSHGRRISTDEELITLTEAAKCLPKVNGKRTYKF